MARLAFTDCLGPCSEANVVFVYLQGRPHWIRRVNSVDVFEALLGWLPAAVARAAPMPPVVAARCFAWTGGGEGPAPPVEDEAR